MGAARCGLAPAAEKFKRYNFLSQICKHYVKWVDFSKRDSGQVKMKNILNSHHQGQIIKVELGNKYDKIVERQ